MVAAGMRAVDGWRARTVVEQNRLLDAARQELLEQTMRGSPREDADTVRLSPLRGVEPVDANSPLVEAITKPSLNDFSQLAVLGGPRNARGAVTWRSIALALQQNPDAGVADALDPHVELVAYDRDLFDILPVR